jgi:uncharacterized membrane protein
MFKNNYLYKFYIYVIEFYFYGFLGWLYEVILTSIVFNKFVDRGILNIPICPIYGFFAFVAVLIFNKLRRNSILIFFVSTIVISLLEYFCSYLIELIFNEHWWDYSNWQFNLNGRIALYTSIGFGLACVLLIKFVHPKIFNFLSKKNNLFISISGIILFIILITDSFLIFSKYF